MSKGAKPPRPKPTTRPKVADREMRVATGDSNGSRVIGDRDVARVAHRHVLDQLGIGEGE